MSESLAKSSPRHLRREDTTAAITTIPSPKPRPPHAAPVDFSSSYQKSVCRGGGSVVSYRRRTVQLVREFFRGSMSMLDREYVAEVSMMSFEDESAESWAIAVVAEFAHGTHL